MPLLKKHTFSLEKLVVILRVKYPFKAETLVECSVAENDYVRLTNRPGNGWLEVQKLDGASIGLIPASYTEVAVTDKSFPVSSSWLNESLANDCVYRVAVHTAAKSAKSRWFFRLDAHLSSGKTVYVSKASEDVYHLHICLSTEYSQLPRFPIFDSNDQDIQNKCEQLQSYFGALLFIFEVQRSRLIKEFFDPHNKVQVKLGDTKSDLFINKSLFANCTIYKLEIKSDETDSQRTLDPTKMGYDMTSLDLPQSETLSTLTSLLQGYAFSESDTDTGLDPPLALDTHIADTSLNDSSLVPSTILEASTPGASTPVIQQFQYCETPKLEPLEFRPAPSKWDKDREDTIKIKVTSMLERDIVALRIRRSELTLPESLWRAVSLKVNKGDVRTNFRLQPFHTKKDMLESQLLQFVKARSKVHLRLSK